NSREIIIEDWCIGCGKCADSCPYGNINMHSEDEKMVDDPANPGKKIAVVQQKATTCDLCRSVDGQPSCVYACPHDAAHRMSGAQLLEEVRLARTGSAESVRKKPSPAVRAAGPDRGVAFRYDRPA